MIRLFPLDFYDVGAIESYFHDMAAEGYFIKKSGFFAHFEKGEPKKVTYRLEPLMKEEERPDESVLEGYLDFGWHYICTMSNRMFYVFASYDEEPQEIHTDTVTQSYTYDYLAKKVAKSRRINIITLAFYLGIMTICSIFGGFDTKFWIESDNTIWFGAIILFAVYTLILSMWEYNKMKRLYEGLKAGIPIKHRTAYKKRYGCYVMSFLLSFVCIFQLCSFIYSFSNEWTKDISKYNDTIPSITLDDIEKSGYKIEPNVIDGVNWNNRIEFKRSELAPVMYEINQRGVVESKRWEDNSGIYSPSVKTDYYELRFKFMRGPLIKNIIDYELEFFKYEEILSEELLNTQFDYAYFVQAKETQMLFAYKDNKVIFVRYHGYGDLKGLTNTIEERIMAQPN